jgi:hypothetical protein
VFLVAAILIQLLFLLRPHLGPEPYRYSERVRAAIAWEQSKTPETKAVLDAEEALLDRHIRLRSTLSVGGFFLINTLLCYFFWNYGKGRAVNKALNATAATPGN